MQSSTCWIPVKSFLLEILNCFPLYYHCMNKNSSLLNHKFHKVLICPEQDKFRQIFMVPRVVYINILPSKCFQCVIKLPRWHNLTGKAVNKEPEFTGLEFFLFFLFNICYWIIWPFIKLKPHFVKWEKLTILLLGLQGRLCLTIDHFKIWN